MVHPGSRDPAGRRRSRVFAYLIRIATFHALHHRHWFWNGSIVEVYGRVPWISAFKGDVTSPVVSPVPVWGFREGQDPEPML